MEKQIRCLLGTLLSFCTGGILWADSSHLYDLSGITPVWDISGTYTEEMTWGSVDLTFVQDGSGKISGGGYWELSEGSDFLSAQVTVKGSLKQAKGLTTLSISIVHKITGVLGGEPGKATVSEQIKAEIDEELLQMRGTISALGETAYFEEDLPEGMDGSCTLEINPVSGGKGIAGQAVVNLSNLETVSFDIKGSDKNGAVKLTLKGSKSTGDAGASISLQIDALSGMMTALKGKVLGQGMAGGFVSPDNPFSWSDLIGAGSDGDTDATPK